MESNIIYKINVYSQDITCNKDMTYNESSEGDINEVEVLSARTIEGVLSQLKDKFHRHNDISEDETELYWDATLESFRDDDGLITYYTSELRATLYKEETTILSVKNI